MVALTLAVGSRQTVQFMLSVEIAYLVKMRATLLVIASLLFFSA
jgi:hypothetical protein